MDSVRASKFNCILSPLNLDTVAKCYVQAKRGMYVQGKNCLLVVKITLSGDVLEIHNCQSTYYIAYTIVQYIDSDRIIDNVAYRHIYVC